MEKLKENKKIVIIISVILVLILGIILILNLNKTKEYEIMFTTDGGTTVSGKKVLEGGKVQKPEDPKKEGYLFVEWTLDGKIFDFSQEITKDMKLEARWYKIEKDTKYFTVKFDSVGGTTISNQIIEEGQIANKPKTPIKEGYIFEIWTLNNEEYDFEQEVKKDITLIAKYVKKGTETAKEENIKVETPTLTNASGSKDKGIISANLNIVTEGYYSDLNNKSQISGFELYEKINNEYNLIDTKLVKDNPFNVNVIVDAGENKTYVAKAFINKNNKKHYSDYSNEIVIDNSKIETPTLTNASGSKDKGIMYVNLNVVSQGAYASDTSQVSGYEIYEKNGSKYTWISTKNNFEKTSVTINPGESKTYLARVFILNKDNKKVYSGYSNQIKIDNSKIETPTLSIPQGSKGEGKLYLGFSIGVEGAYSIKESLSQITGYEFYEKQGDKYNLISDHKITYNKTNDFYQVDANNMIFDVGENRNFVARTYATTTQGKKVYSAYSNVVSVNNKVETPTLSTPQGSKGKGQLYLGFSIGVVGAYSTKDSLGQIKGYEFYEKIGNEYKLLSDHKVTYNKINDFYQMDANNIIFDVGEKRNFVARTYAMNNQGKKVYSAYSNVVNVNNKVETPTLSIPQGSKGSDGTIHIGLSIGVQGHYANISNIENIDGYELYEKVGNEYKLIDTKLTTDYLVSNQYLKETDSKTYIARAFATNKNGKRIYSAYSNEVNSHENFK